MYLLLIMCTININSTRMIGWVYFFSPCIPDKRKIGKVGNYNWLLFQ